MGVRPNSRTRPVLQAALGAMALALPAWAQGPEPQFDVCRTQIERDVAERFGQTVTDILWRHVFDRDDMRRFNFGQAIVSVAECPGWHFFDVRATADTCERQAHFGKVPNYVFYRSSGDGC